jgi:hypothetical protein
LICRTSRSGLEQLSNGRASKLVAEKLYDKSVVVRKVNIAVKHKRAGVHVVAEIIKAGEIRYARNFAPIREVGIVEDAEEKKGGEIGKCGRPKTVCHDISESCTQKLHSLAGSVASPGTLCKLISRQLREHG